MEVTKRVLLTALASAALATGALGAPAAPVLGNGQPQGAPAPEQRVVANAGCCASSAFAVSFVEQGDKVRVRIRDTAEGWTWESPAIDGHVVPHLHGETPCRATVQDMDADQQPEVIVTISDGEPGGSVWIWKKDAQAHAFRPIPVEVGPNVGTRDFLVWDLESSGPNAPVKITPYGHVEIQGHLFALLGQTSGVGLFRWRVSRGMVRHLETIASKP